MIGRTVIGLALAVAASVAGAGRAAATDDYTLPFYDPAVVLSYGVDRDSRPCYQRDWANQLWADCNLHYGRVYDGHTGADYPMPDYSDVAAARSGTVVDLFEAFGTDEFGTNGNFVLLSHSDGKRTLYYHLAHNGVRVNVGDAVSAGQWIAESGCSGQCYGSHLHFELRILSNGHWTFADPIFEQRYTTNPGRVPFRAQYLRESNNDTEVIRRYSTITHWVEFKNLGGRTWKNNIGVGRILLGTWDPPTRSSDFRASDWPSTWVATNLDQTTVLPNGTGRFTFGLHAIDPPGMYLERFNILANALYWFDYNQMGEFYVPIHVITNETE